MLRTLLQIHTARALCPAMPHGAAISLARPLSSSQRFFAAGSLFGDVTQPKTAADANTPANLDNSSDSILGQDNQQVKPEKDVKLQQFYEEEARREQQSRDKYVSAIKRALFDANVAEHGFYKNNQIVLDPETGKRYKLLLTPEEIDLLEPTIYLHLYRIKLSMKKATAVNRFVRGMPLKNAINQLHFNPKKMATELEKFLKNGLEQCRKSGYDENSAYIQALWTGSDGAWIKRPDIKGRGRTGIIEHPYIHLKAIIKTSATKRRLEWEQAQKQLAARPRVYMNTEPLNFKVRGLYKW